MLGHKPGTASQLDVERLMNRVIIMAKYLNLKTLILVLYGCYQEEHHSRTQVANENELTLPKDPEEFRMLTDSEVAACFAARDQLEAHQGTPPRGVDWYAQERELKRAKRKNCNPNGFNMTDQFGYEPFPDARRL